MKTINRKNILIALAILLAGILAGRFLFNGSPEAREAEHEHVTGAEDGTVWTCSMHPQIRQSEPGNCPICGMELIPLESDEGGTDPMAVSMSATAMKLADVQTMKVGSDNPVKSIRLNGKVQADERLRFTQSSHVPGRIEKLMVNFTGEYVSEGQLIAYIYSPELATAQEELLEAQKMKETQPSLFRSAKEKLKNWKLGEEQIARILSTGKPMEQFPVLANVSGYVSQKFVNLGDYIKQGQPLYEIADLSKVWVMFDVYESDMRWVDKGDRVRYTIQSVPGEAFEGVISYLDPAINPGTRVARARVEVKNSGMQLRPGMFASGVVETQLSEVEGALVIPKSAVMWTGVRSVVYVKDTTSEGISFRMREVTLGPSLGESYVVESGLEEGEEIAVHGTFSIDAAAQLAGKPSMMNPEGGVAMRGHDHGSGAGADPQKSRPAGSQGKPATAESKQALIPLFRSYFEMKDALAGDDLPKARKAGEQLRTALVAIEVSSFRGSGRDLWMDQSSRLHGALQHVEHRETIGELRNSFMAISKAMIAIAESFDPVPGTLYIQHCPMADSNKGADWLSREQEIRNPYFGASMLTCGEVVRTVE